MSKLVEKAATQFPTILLLEKNMVQLFHFPTRSNIEMTFRLCLHMENSAQLQNFLQGKREEDEYVILYY